jgi:hypothetical protein
VVVPIVMTPEAAAETAKHVGHSCEYTRSRAMKEFIYTIAMAQPIVLAYEAAWRENVVMTLFWLLIVLILHFMANEEALKR